LLGFFHAAGHERETVQPQSNIAFRGMQSSSFEAESSSSACPNPAEPKPIHAARHRMLPAPIFTSRQHRKRTRSVERILLVSACGECLSGPSIPPKPGVHRRKHR
jgi:hypothetical protein